MYNFTHYLSLKDSRRCCNYLLARVFKDDYFRAVIFNNESATIIDNEIKNQDSEKGKVGEGEHKVLEEQRSRKTTVKFSDVKYSDV